MDGFDCTAAGREIAAFVEQLSNWYVRLSRRRFWEATGLPSPPCATACWRPRRCSPPSRLSSPTRSTSNLAGGEGRSSGELPDSVHLRDFPSPDPCALADPELEAAMEAVRLTVELGRAARAQAKVKMRQPLRRR
jgi:isoleucyl-tRNA synthetase